MPDFQFRLSRVLEWYQVQCREEEHRLAHCVAALAKAQKEIARLRVENLRIERETLAAGSLVAQDFWALGLYRLRAKIQAAELEQDRLRCERAWKDQTAAVQAAQRRLRMVEKLRERRLSEYRYAEDRALENLAAEAYLSKWAAEKRLADAAADREAGAH